MRFSITLSGFDRFERAVAGQSQVVAAPFAGAAGTRVLAAVRKAIAEEFSRGAERTDSGFAAWPVSRDFGNRRASTPPLGGAAGRYAKAWAGGKGGFAAVSPLQITLGSRLPGASAHRGDNGAVTVIRPLRQGARGRSRMGWALGLGYGAWISEARLRAGLRLPARPHAQANNAMLQIVQRALLGAK